METSKLLGKRAIKRIATAYDEAEDQLPNIPEQSIHQFRQIICSQFMYLSHIDRRIYFDFVDKDPYKYVKVKDMLEDYEHGLLKINSSGNDSKMWGPVYNLMFRAVHDWVHCSRNLDFNYPDEVKAFKFQVEFSEAAGGRVDWNMYERVLRSEIIYQAAYKTHFNVFHVPFQKIILSDL